MNSGVEAVSVTNNQVFDIIFMDMQMPGLDGLETTKLIRHASSKNSNKPIIALTANSSKEDRMNCKAVGMNSFLAKPLVKNDLIKVLERYAKNKKDVKAPKVES